MCTVLIVLILNSNYYLTYLKKVKSFKVSKFCGINYIDLLTILTYRSLGLCAIKL